MYDAVTPVSYNLTRPDAVSDRPTSRGLVFSCRNRDVESVVAAREQDTGLIP